MNRLIIGSVSYMVVLAISMVLFGCLPANGQSLPSKEPCQRRNQVTLKSMKQRTILHSLIEQGYVGSGQFSFWRNEMKVLGVKHAVGVTDIERFPGHLSFRVIGISFYRTTLTSSMNNESMIQKNLKSFKDSE